MVILAETAARYPHIKGLSAYHKWRLPLFPFLYSVFSLFDLFLGVNLFLLRIE